ncbi:hypothetical protein CDL60_12845 [Roseateles noduli]|nr:hypothetical protein CDL60_12845 [Roseateles noduli]
MSLFKNAGLRDCPISGLVAWRTSFVGIVSALLLLGCATTVPTSTLRPATEKRPITFAQDFVYDISKDSDLPRPEAGAVRGLLAGIYVPEFEDDQGTYYRGQGTCVIVNSNPVSSKKRFVQQGGVWIERGTASPKFKLYRDLNATGMVLQPFEGGGSDVDPCRNGGASATSNAAAGKSDVVQPAGIVTLPGIIPAGATPGQAGVGAGIGMAVVEAMIASGKDKLLFLPAPGPAIRIDGRFTQAER